MFEKNAKHQVNAGNRYIYVHHLLKYLDPDLPSHADRMNPQLPDTGAIFPAVLGNDSLAKALEVFKEETLLQTHLYILTPTHPSIPYHSSRNVKA